jgi:hypothetical protein
MADKKKCKECGAPLEGLLFNTIGKIFGIKESENAPGFCNKCKLDTNDKTKQSSPEEEKVDENQGEDELIEDTEEPAEETDSEEIEKE